MPTVDRLSSNRYPANSGAGAALHGERWNPIGTPAIYCAENRLLAALEILVHYSVLPRGFVMTRIGIDPALIRDVDPCHEITSPIRRGARKSACATPAVVILEMLSRERPSRSRRSATNDVFRYANVTPASAAIF
jgi:RES domain